MPKRTYHIECKPQGQHELQRPSTGVINIINQRDPFACNIARNETEIFAVKTSLSRDFLENIKNVEKITLLVPAAAQPGANGRDAVEHELKTDPDIFDAILSGKKRYDIRLNDRGYRIGDTLKLRKTLHTNAQMKTQNPDYALEYVGPPLYVYVTHILHGPMYGVKEGFVIMSIECRDTGA